MRIVKIGGSLLAEKGKEPRFEGAVLTRILAQMRASGNPPEILIHGAGAYGHNAAAKARDPEDIPPRLVPLIRSQVFELRAHVSLALAESGLIYCPATPQEMFTMERRGHPLSAFARQLVDDGQPMLTWGDVAFEHGRCRVYSGDEAALDLARNLGGRHEFIFATDVPGIIDPGTEAVIPEFTRPMMRIFRTSGKTGRPDVTGGMARKASRGLEIAELGHSVTILGGRVPGALESALSGRKVGTRIIAAPRKRRAKKRGV